MCIAQALMHVRIVTTILLSVNGLAMLCDISSGHNKPSDYIIYSVTIICTSIAAYTTALKSLHSIKIVNFASLISVHVMVV